MAGKRDLSFYLKLKYPVQLEEQEEGWFFARIPDLLAVCRMGGPWKKP
jgi:hypothetical protein